MHGYLYSLKAELSCMPFKNSILLNTYDWPYNIPLCKNILQPLPINLRTVQVKYMGIICKILHC